MFDNISSQMQASGLLREADRDHRKLQFDTKFLENKSTTIKFFTKGSPVRFIISGHPLKEPLDIILIQSSFLKIVSLFLIMFLVKGI